MRGLARSRRERASSVAVLALLVMFAVAPAALAAPPQAPSSSGSVTTTEQTPAWLLSILRQGQQLSSSSPPNPDRDASPTYATTYQEVSVKSQTPGNFIYYSPAEISKAYNLTTLHADDYGGAGETISIVDAYGDPYIQSELNNFSATFGIPTTTVHVACVDGPCDYYSGITEGWNTEIALDVEWSHALAPNATINLYIGSNAGAPLYDAVAAAVAGTTGNGTYLSPSSIISMSWGSPENDIGESGSIAPLFGANYPWLNAVFQQGTAQGITFFASTGDWGAYDQAYGQDTPYGGAIYPSTDPFVTAVGGTSLYLAGNTGYIEFPGNATGGYGYETAWSWNDVWEWGTGGGPSTLFGRPSWQTGSGLPGNDTRAVPDVSWDADPQTGVLVDVDGVYYIVGGTSVGSPSWAGSMAVMDQFAGRNLGLVNPDLYAIYNNPSEYAKAFHDVQVGNNDPNQAGRGWDPDTGIGTPNVGELASYLAQPSSSFKVLASNGVSQGTTGSYTNVSITAVAYNGSTPVTTGTAVADITSSSGAALGSAPLTYNSTADQWQGSFAISPSDPPGMWTATVHVTEGAGSGTGWTTFAVGDGVTIFETWGSFTVGENIPVSVIVTSPGGRNVTAGSFEGTFYLNSPSGPQQGSVALSFDPATQMWDGTFHLSHSVTQGTWVLVVSGTDSAGNRAAPAYSWVNVGLPSQILTFEPSGFTPNFLRGETIYIAAYVGAGTGSYSVTIRDDGTTVGVAPLGVYFGGGFWLGAFSTTNSDPTGFYKLTLSGSDAGGDRAFGENVVRVAPSSLSVSATISSPIVRNSTTVPETVSARISLPNSTAVRLGSVIANTTFGAFPLTYQAGSGDFVGYFKVPSEGGNYSLSVNAFDVVGDYGQENVTFFDYPVTTNTTVSCGALSVQLNGPSDTCTANVSGVHPAGQVLWSQLGSGGEVSFSQSACTLSDGSCSVGVSGLTVGDVNVSATYEGNTYNTPSNSSVQLLVSSIVVTCSNPTRVVGMAGTCKAKVVGVSMPSGMVNWSTNSSGRFSAVRCRLTHASCQVTYTPTVGGPVTISAAYSGDSHNPPSTNNATLVISPKASRTTVTCSPVRVSISSARQVGCTAVVTGYSPTMTVTWSQSGSGSVGFSSATCTLSRGRCFVMLTPLTAGTVRVTATYGGDVSNTASSGSRNVKITS